MEYEIFADEAWTHETPPPNRYWCFHGGFLARAPVADSTNTALKKIQARHGKEGVEVKWTKLTALNERYYTELLDEVFRRLLSRELRFRQLFLDRSFVRVADPDETPGSSIDVQFKLYYQFLKHAFGVQHLPALREGTTLRIRLDTHSSQRHRDGLRDFAEDLPRLWCRPDIDVKLSFHRSRDFLLIQLADLLIGAAGNYGNRRHDIRIDGRRGMTRKQKLRLRVAKHIYNQLRAIDAAHRGSRAFNWFESTGISGTVRNRFDHGFAVWKFKPARYQVDKGWHRDHLDRQGRYVAEDLQPEVHEAGERAPWKGTDL